MFLAKLNSAFRRSAISVTDKRVQTMNEFLTCIKLIKMYAWEKSFTNTIRGRMSSSLNNHLCCRMCSSKGFLRFLGPGIPERAWEDPLSCSAAFLKNYGDFIINPGICSGEPKGLAGERHMVTFTGAWGCWYWPVTFYKNNPLKHYEQEKNCLKQFPCLRRCLHVHNHTLTLTRISSLPATASPGLDGPRTWHSLGRYEDAYIAGFFKRGC